MTETTTQEEYDHGTEAGLTLNGHLRDNLLWRLSLGTGNVDELQARYRNDLPRDAFRAANTGDWAGEIWFALKPELGPGRPNGNPYLDQPRVP